MHYIDHIVFPNEDIQWQYRIDETRTCFDSMYPFFINTKNGFERMDFDRLTILCGGNGTGKSTLLNVIANKAGATRHTPFNTTPFFDDFVNLSTLRTGEDLPTYTHIVTSDDVFDYMLDVRNVNMGIDATREKLFEEHYHARHSRVLVRSLEDYDALKKQNSARRRTKSDFVRSELVHNIPSKSNGENAWWYFVERLQGDGLYFLDEPENSLSPQRQMELADLLYDCVRFMGCQIVLATHSPFLLAIEGAKIYNLNQNPVTLCQWHELEHVRAYQQLFEKHRADFR